MGTKTTMETSVDLPNLCASTEYIFEIRACNILDSRGDGCSKFVTKTTFLTERGTIGKSAGVSISAKPHIYGIIMLASYM